MKIKEALVIGGIGYVVGILRNNRPYYKQYAILRNVKGTISDIICDKIERACYKDGDYPRSHRHYRPINSNVNSSYYNSNEDNEDDES